MKLILARILAIVWSAFIASSCLLPPSLFKPFTFHILLWLDKFIHLVLYFVFVQLWILNLEKINRKNKLVILLIGIIYGIFIEVMQSAMNIGRSYEIDDMIANTLGCILGIVFMTITQNSLALIKKYLPFQQKGN